MGDFGKRGSSTGRSAPRQRASRGAAAPSAPAPEPEDLISRGDLKALENGRVPAWANMSRLKLLGSALILALIVLANAAANGPEVLRDIRYAGTWQVANDLRADHGTCKRYVFLVSSCSAEIRSQATEELVASTSFLMFFRNANGVEMIPMRSSGDPSAVGIEYAVSDLLINRALSLLGFTLFFGSISLAFLNCVCKGRYKDGPAYHALLQHLSLQTNPA